MKVLLRNPRREVEVDGPIRVLSLLDRLELNRESVLVVRGDTLVPGDALLEDTDEVEIRPVMSGGFDGPAASAAPELLSAAKPLECDGGA